MLYADCPLTTLTAMLDRMGGGDETNAADDTLIMEHVITATDLLSQACQRVFVPYRATKTYDALGEHIGCSDVSLGLPGWTGYQTLMLDNDLLEVKTLTNGDGTVITSVQYALRGRGYPKWMIELLPSASLAWTYSTDWQDAISVDAIWGYHEDYSRAWVNSGDAIKDALGIDATTQAITVADADGKDARYRTRFQVGHILKIEDEFMRVVAVTAGTTNTLTVLRGINGTTAATHAKDTAIYTYAPMRNVEQACLTLAIWLHRNKGTAGDVVQYLMDGTKIESGDVPQNVRRIVDGYQRVKVR
jgi:hypothetical protein